MTDAERIAGLEGQLKAQAGNAEEEARQNAAELGHLRQRIAELESERDRALCARDAHCKKWLDAEKRVTSYQDRAKSAEARLAQARKSALEEAAELCDEWLAAYGKVDIQYVSAREYASGAIADLAEVLRALASDTGTGGGE